jgi:predicted transcriptional regulator
MAAELLKLTSEIVAAHVMNNSVRTNDLPDLITSVYAALAKAADPVKAEAPAKVAGAVTLRKSLSDPAKIISMIDGKEYSMLKKHIARHGYTPESYREAFGLPSSYPMVADGYRAVRSEIAKNIGLGRKTVDAAIETAEAASEAGVEIVKRTGKGLGVFAAKAAAVAHLSGNAESGLPAEVLKSEVANDEPKRTGWWSRPAE